MQRKCHVAYGTSSHRKRLSR